MDWIITPENLSTLIAISGTFLIAIAGILLGR
jgi:hypothetical protein